MGRRKEREATLSYYRLKTGEEEGGGSARQVRKGYVPVFVGEERFMVQTKFFGHPCFLMLLEMAAEEFGYNQQGVIRLPCDLEHFRHVIDVVSEVA